MGDTAQLPPPRYIAKWGRVREEIEFEDDSEAPMNARAIAWAESCNPPPEEVIKVETANSAAGVRTVEAVVYQFMPAAHAPLARHGITLDIALENFMALAFEGGQDQVTWRGPKGLNQAIADLKAAYFAEKPDAG